MVGIVKYTPITLNFQYLTIINVCLSTKLNVSCKQCILNLIL